MALDRQSIEKRDFPIGRRGYEPDAVDAHLARISEEVDRLRREAGNQPKASPATIAQAAAEQVRSIVEAAENSAADIERQAHAEAERIREDADSDARSTREEALSASRDHTGKVREATQLMLQRVDAMENELGALIESLRTGANRLSADLSLLEGNLGELYDAVGSPRGPIGGTAEPETSYSPDPVASEPQTYESDVYTPPEPEQAQAYEAQEHHTLEPDVYTPPEPDQAHAYEPAHDGQQGDAYTPPEPEIPAYEPEPYTPPATETQSAGMFGGGGGGAFSAEPDSEYPSPDPEPSPTGSSSDADVEGARLVALNMALNGQTRDEADRYLAENFDLPDRRGLLDEVYATIEG